MASCTTAIPRRQALAAALLCASAVSAQPAPPASRGALLYHTHCIACHTEQMHWRTLKQARDWDSLQAQVRRWQGIARLGWNETDIADVTRHLNDSIYQFPEPQPRAAAPGAALRP